MLPGKAAGVKLTMSAVARGDRNAEWAVATPMGNLTMTINNPVAAQHWIDFMMSARDTGKQHEFFLDLGPSTDGWPGDGHAFRLSENISEGTYGFGKCGECGMGKDDDLMEYDQTVGKSVAVGKAHPAG